MSSNNYQPNHCDSLPGAVLALVFGFVAPEDVFTRCRLVCARWRESRAAWSKLVLHGTSQEAQALLRASERYVVRGVTVNNRRSPEVMRVMHVVSAWPRLQRLEVNGTNDDELSYVGALAELEELKVNGSMVTLGDEFVRHLAELGRLKVLSLAAFCGLTDEGLRHVARLRGLESLTLTWCPHFTSEGLRHLSMLTRLQTLDLEGCRRVTVDFRHLALLRGLKCLNLADSRVTDESLRSVSALVLLEDLNLQCCNLVSDEGVRHLSMLLKLKKLRLSFCYSLTDETVRHVSGLLALEELAFVDCHKLTDEGLVHLGALPNLELLKVTASATLTLCRMGGRSLRRLVCFHPTNEILRHSSGLPTLQKLTLDGCAAVTDAGLRHLCLLPNLHELKVLSCHQVTDEGLRHLSLVLSLQKLVFSGSDYVTAEGFRYLCKLLELRSLTVCLCSGVRRTVLHDFVSITRALRDMM